MTQSEQTAAILEALTCDECVKLTPEAFSTLCENIEGDMIYYPHCDATRCIVVYIGTGKLELYDLTGECPELVATSQLLA